MSENAKYWIWLQNVLGYSAKLSKIIDEFSSAKDLYNAGEIEWRMSTSLTEKQVQKLITCELNQSEEVILSCNDNNWQIIDYDDSRYPNRLKQIIDPPAVLYACGELPDIDNLVAIGIVGTRKASEYAVKATHILSKGITEAGALVVSGGALGIDTYAHKGAISAGGKTVAVLGNGLGANYLKQNESLRKIISQNGALVTEFQPFTPATKITFPLRNRIISGLSLGVVVVEAGVKSGSLITANLAINQNRDVYAVPSSIMASEFAGTNKLIADGAKLALDPISILQDYASDYDTIDLSKVRSSVEIMLDSSEQNLDLTDVKKKSSKELNEKPTVENNKVDKKYSFDNLEQGRRHRLDVEEKVLKLTGNNKKVYDCLSDQYMNIDDIIEKVDIPPAKVLSALTYLEIIKVIESASGKRFKLS